MSLQCGAVQGWDCFKWRGDPSVSHCETEGLWGWLGVRVGLDRGPREADMQDGEVWQLRVRSRKGQQQSPSLPHHSL